MRYLLDTHTLIWWGLDATKLGARARDVLASGESDVFVSAASIWEISTKWRIGKLPEVANPQMQIPALIAKNRFRGLGIAHEHAMLGGLLENDHRDPFDRLIAAQAIVEEMVVVTRDPKIAAFGCAVIW